MEFKEEAFSQIYAEATPLLEQHHKEISKYDFDLDPDLETYKKLSELRIYQSFTVRDEGELVGYAGFFVSPKLHFKSVLQAINDVIYIQPALRGNGIGKHFISYIDDAMKFKGVDVTFYNVPAKNDWSIILKDKGYELHDYLYSRRNI